MISDRPKILLTTPDYPPQLGGLSTYTLDIETVLKSLGIEYDVYHWKSAGSIKKGIQSFNIQQYSKILNISYLFGVMSGVDPSRSVNFLFGSEILFTSPVLWKRLAKSLLKKQHLKFMEASLWNLFISDATLRKLTQKGFSPSYQRDLLLHACINTEGSDFNSIEIGDEMIFVCIARDVPHKNIQGTVEFCEKIAQISGKKISLHLLGKPRYTSQKISIHNHENISNENRDRLYAKSHFNLLLSLDHSHRGFYEGYGLSVPEAAKFGTPSIVSQFGGLPENVHHGKNGYIVELGAPNAVESIWQDLKKASYQDLRKESFNHLHTSHSLISLSRFIAKVVL